MMVLNLLLASVINISVVESPSYTKQMVVAAHELSAQYPDVQVSVRTTEQVLEMEPGELGGWLKRADVLVLGRVYGDVATRILDATRGITPSKVIFAAHSDFAIYEMARYGAERPFAGITHEQIQQISAGVLPAKDIPQLRRWSRGFEYLLAKGPENFRNLFLHLLSNIDSRYQPEPPRIPPAAFIYKNGAIYATADEFASQVRPGRPGVVLIDHDNYYHSGDVELADRIVAEMDSAGINAIPVFAAWGEATGAALRDFLKSTRERWDIRAVVSLQSFVLGGDQAREKVSGLLEELRLPVFRAMRITKRSPDQWLLSADGLPWASVYYQVAMPELQGMIEPIAVAAELERIIDSKTGAAIASFVPIDSRIKKMVERVRRWIDLQNKPASEKRVALVYYNHPPGKQNIGADYLNVPETILQLLHTLARDGYVVRDVPPHGDALVDLLTRRGINVANWAAGQRRLLANSAGKLSAADYERWYRTLDPVARAEMEHGPLGYVEAIIERALKLEDHSTARAQVDRVVQDVSAFADNYPEEVRKPAKALLRDIQSKALATLDGVPSDFTRLKQELMGLKLEGLSGWGKPPGDVMVTDSGDLIIPGVQFGNVFIGPQPQRGWQADADSLHSSNVVPPHHQYLAFYTYLRDVFKADVIVHIGRHSSYEWLPRKQVALADFDFPDIVIGNVPAVYLYTVDGVGEGLQAKRRGLSVVIDHLIPPLKTTELYGSVLEFQQLLEQYEAQDVPERRTVIARELRSRINQYHFASDLGQDILQADDDRLVHTLGHYLEELKTTFLPYGLHTFGKPWTEAETDLLVNSMASMGGGNPDEYREKIRQSFNSEIRAFLGALRGEYVSPGKGNDPIRTPDVLPTGRNFYAVDASVMPTKVSYTLATQLVAEALAKNTRVPEKVAAVLWAVETVRDEGTMLSFVVQMLGVEPVWDARGLVKTLKLVPAEKLGRPRVDVVVTSSGLFRDLFGQLVLLVDRAFRYALAGSYRSIVATAPELQAALDAAVKDVPEEDRGRESLATNAVARHWILAARNGLSRGLTPQQAGVRAAARIFGPAEGAYGSGINRVIEQAWTWNSRDQVADVYLGKMGHAYSAEEWGAADPTAYRDVLQGIEQSFHSRATNLYGIVDNDDYFDYFGGLSLAIERVNGRPPANYVLFYADPQRSKVETLEHFLTREMRSRYYNPEWIQGMMKEGYSGARTISNKFFEFAWGWQVTNPEIMRDWMWDEITDIYFHDKHKIGVTQWFENEQRAYAMINMASILLTAANKGFWKARPETISELSNTLGRLVVRYGPSCSAHVCGNHNTIEWSRQWMSENLRAAYTRVMAKALSGSGYSGISALSSSAGRASPGRSGRRLFDFTVDRLPGTEPALLTIVESMFRRFRSEEWTVVLVWLIVFSLAAGTLVFFARDQYHRRRGAKTIELFLRSD